MKIVQAFMCEHCKMISLIRGSVKRHEQQCVHDPKVRACATCIHFTENERDYDDKPTFKKDCDIHFEDDVVRNCQMWEPK